MSTLPSKPASSELHGTLSIWDGPVFYRQSGAPGGQRPPLLLLHGWGGSSAYWSPTLAELSDERLVLAPDLPGFGQSPPLRGDASPERMAEMVIAFADALGIEQFDLNGHSFTASVATFVAARNPGRVRRLVLTCMSTYRSERERRLVSQIHNILALWMAMRRPWMARVRPLRRAIGSRFFYRIPENSALLEEAILDFLRMDQRTALETAAGAGDPVINISLAALRCPTLVVGARNDNIMPPPGTPEVARLVPDSRLVWIERCGHLPMIERPEIYHRLLREFLDSSRMPSSLPTST